MKEYCVRGTSLQLGQKTSIVKSKLEAIKKGQQMAASKMFFYVAVVGPQGEHVIDFSGMGVSNA